MSRRFSLSETAMRLLNLAAFSPRGLQAAKMRISAPIPEKQRVFGTAPEHLRKPLLAGNRGKLTRKKRKEMREREENNKLARQQIMARMSKAERRYRDGNGSEPRQPWWIRNAQVSINGSPVGTGDVKISH